VLKVILNKNIKYKKTDKAETNMNLKDISIDGITGRIIESKNRSGMKCLRLNELKFLVIKTVLRFHSPFLKLFAANFL
jgi:hypothetical protein